VVCGGDFGKEFGPGVSGELRADSLAVPADGFPVTFALVVGVPEAVHAVSFAGFGIALGGQAVKDAFKLGFDVFSAGCVAHESKVPASSGEGKMLIQNLSKTEILDKFLSYNIVVILSFSAKEEFRCDRERASIVPKHSLQPAFSRSAEEKYFSATPCHYPADAVTNGKRAHAGNAIRENSISDISATVKIVPPLQRGGRTNFG
jgi:hypothetical protein